MAPDQYDQTPEQQYPDERERGDGTVEPDENEVPGAMYAAKAARDPGGDRDPDKWPDLKEVPEDGPDVPQPPPRNP